MPMIQYFRAISVCFLVGLTVVLAGCGSSETHIVRQGSLSFGNETDKPAKYELGEGSWVVLSPKAKVTMDINFGKGNRYLGLDGEALVIIPKASGDSFIITTRNLRIAVLDDAKIHIDAYAANAGEQADLLTGKLRVEKTYHSTTDNQPEMLAAGDLVMINRDIDLMEKEKMNEAELAALKKRFEGQ